MSSLEGSFDTINLALADMPEEVSARDDRESKRARSSKDGQMILVVEPNPSAARKFSQLLNNTGFGCCIASNEAAVSTVLLHTQVDCIVIETSVILSAAAPSLQHGSSVICALHDPFIHFVVIFVIIHRFLCRMSLEKNVQVFKPKQAHA